VAFYVTVTSIAGAFAGYFIGMFFWENLSPFIYSYIFSEKTFNLVVERVHDSTFLFILFGAFSPLPFKAFSLSAGSMGLGLVPFAMGTLIGRGVRYFTLGFLIHFFGDSIKEFIDKRLEFLFLIAGLIVFILLALKLYFT
jgi:membrane protein YqaA with SNARE-associated domain